MLVEVAGGVVHGVEPLAVGLLQAGQELGGVGGEFVGVQLQHPVGACAGQVQGVLALGRIAGEGVPARAEEAAGSEDDLALRVDGLQAVHCLGGIQGGGRSTRFRCHRS